MFVQDGSALYRGTGLNRSEMYSRFNSSSAADIRFYMLTDFALKREAGKSVNPGKVCNWRLIPEKVVSGYLATDTLSLTNNRTVRQ